jgi:hypothetical protein
MPKKINVCSSLTPVPGKKVFVQNVYIGEGWEVLPRTENLGEGAALSKNLMSVPAKKVFVQNVYIGGCMVLKEVPCKVFTALG